MIAVLIAYLAFLLIVARRRGAKSEADSADDFFNGGRRSSWPMVAWGMVGASVSGVSFVSVPGMVQSQDMTYLQTCLGFILGYAVVAFVLLPIYYRMRLTSIYTLLQERLGDGSYRVGAWLFMLGELLGTAVKFYLVCMVLQRFVFDAVGLPFAVSVPLLVVCIWLYTRHGGVRTLVLTDVLQTTCMLLALCVVLWAAATLSPVAVSELEHTRVFEFDDWHSTQYFWRQFISGAFIVVVMTGLNQNMMQKNLTCRTLRDAQKDMCFGGLLFVPFNALFLLLGALLLTVGVDASGDQLLPTFIEQLSSGDISQAFREACASNSPLLTPNSQFSTLNSQLSTFNSLVQCAFVLGIASAAFSSADSSLTALTTSYCVDVARKPNDTRLRHRVHLVMAAMLIVLVYLLRLTGSKSLIDLVYTLVSYSYGPLLALFALALLKRSGARQHKPQNLPLSLVAPVCLASPLACYVIAQHITLGYELLLLNALITFIPLAIASKLRKRQCANGS